MLARTQLVLALGIASSIPGQDRTTSNDRFTTDRSSPVVLALPVEDDAFQFAVFGDRTGGVPAGLRVLEQAVRDVDVIGPDLVMTVGDLVQGYNARAEWLTQAAEYKTIMAGLRMPWFPVAGNHDVYWRGADRPPLEHEGDFEQHFGPLWYAFEHKRCWFVVLFSDESMVDGGTKDFNDARNHRMSERQFAWLERMLARAKRARHVFLFLHHPRWIGGKYGDHWNAVHSRLVAAGNVTAVFAGHIHRMTHELRDGIRYYALATTGGVQDGLAPRAGWLHHYDLVTVREKSLDVATVPVGEVIDPETLTEPVVQATATVVRTLRPSFDGELAMAADCSAVGTVTMTLANPVPYPLEVECIPASADPRWTIEPDHAHVLLAAAGNARVEWRVRRIAEGPDRAFDLPKLSLRIDLVAPNARVPLPERGFDWPVAIDGRTWSAQATDHVLSLDGDGDWLAVANDQLALHDGPFTVEARFRAESFEKRVGLVNKTESAEFGIFLNAGVPSFIVHLGDRYATVEAGAAASARAWHHVAGVFDGKELRLYVDGKLTARKAASGSRTRNALPLLVGADVDGKGLGTSEFTGAIDEVRISSIARYAGEVVEPRAHHEPNDSTVLLLPMDVALGAMTLDLSRQRAHARIRGDAVLAPSTSR